MNARVAEALVCNWQNIKSQAFGPDHCLERLQEVRNSNLSDPCGFGNDNYTFQKNIV